MQVVGGLRMNCKRAFCALLVALFAAGYSGASVSAKQHLAIPSYFYPGPLWQQMEQASPTVGMVLINPDSGPGAQLDSSYVAEVQRAHDAGLVVLGYVYTQYGARSAQSVEADVSAYYSRYSVDGIFFDEASTDCGQLSFYQSLRDFVKAQTGLRRVVLNHGTNPAVCYMKVADVVVNFEDNYTNYTNFQPANWVSRFPADRFWQIVYNTTAQQLPNAIALSKTRLAGWVYVTEDTLPNPYDTLPGEPYWTTELNLVAQ